MSEALAIDTAHATEVARACTTAGEVAGRGAETIRTSLAGVGLDAEPAALVDEIAAELMTLGRFLDDLVDRAELADHVDAFAGASWYSAMESGWRATADELWAGLRDDLGATAMEVGTFSLGDALVRIPRHEWMPSVLRPDCASFGPDHYYSGGGAVRGPDGRLYPIVVPHVRDGDRHVTADADLPAGVPSVASLAGRDEGWYAIGYRTGVAQIFPDVGPFVRAVTGLAVATGLPMPPSISDDHLVGVGMRLGSRPSFGGPVTVTPGAETDPLESIPSVEPTVWLMVDGRAGLYRVSDLPDQNRAVRRAAARLGVDPAAPARANAAASALGLAIGGLQGLDAALHMNDHNSRAYEVIFEEHVDGRVRARVQSFALEAGPQGPFLSGWHLFLDDDGDLVQSPISYLQGPVWTSTDTIFAGNPIDPDVTIRIGATALEIER